MILPSWSADPSYCRDRLSVGQAVFLLLKTLNKRPEAATYCRSSMDESNSLLSCHIRVQISSAMLCPRGGMDDHTGFRFRRCRFESCRGCLKGAWCSRKHNGLQNRSRLFESGSPCSYSGRLTGEITCLLSRSCGFEFRPEYFFPWRSTAVSAPG